MLSLSRAQQRMLSRAQQRRAEADEADSWLFKHEGWDNGIPHPQSLAQPLFTCPENEDGREKYDTRRAVPEPEAWLPDLPCFPKKRKRGHKKAVNIQLISWALGRSLEQDCFEGQYVTLITLHDDLILPVFLPVRIAQNALQETLQFAARINRKHDYALSQYKGKYRDVLSLLLMRLPTKIIAEHLGKSPRRIRQIVNGNKKRGTIGLRQFIADLCEPPPDVGRVLSTGAGVEHGI